MADTPYTEGFKAGMAWREAEVIELLKAARSVFRPDTLSYDTMTGLIGLIKGEK